MLKTGNFTKNVRAHEHFCHREILHFLMVKITLTIACKEILKPVFI